jgi:penicillin-binding protein-related factor A (putative recombinase)
MTEKDFQGNFTKWAKHNVHTNMACELKLVRTERMPLSAIADHQWICLKNAKSRNMVYKIPDVGMAPKPFDCFVLSGSEAYFVIMFYERAQKEFYMIDVDTLFRFMESGAKSLTREEARSLAERIERLA